MARALRRVARSAVPALVAALLVTGMPALSGAQEPAAADVRPNFVVILTDDQRWDTIGRCANGFDGNDFDAGADSCMPNLQRLLMANGMTFRRGYATTSLCCPSRASVLTGNYSRHTGVVDNFGFPQFDDSSSLATWLDDAGYRTGMIGKYLNGYGESCCVTPPEYVPSGWDVWHSFWGRPGYTDYSMVHMDEGRSPVTTSYSGTATAPTACAPGVVYSTDHLCRRALDFMAADPNDPFFLFFNPFAPHEVETPPSRWAGIYTPNNQRVSPPRYPNYNEVPSPNPPSWLPANPFTEEAARIMDAGFLRGLRTMRAVDDAIAVFVDQLSSDGRIDNTVIIFTSDNGFARGEHRYNAKACEYEECHRVPFVIACPPAVCSDAATNVINEDNFVLNIDVAPTIAELAGVTIPGRVDGRSLVPLLDGSTSEWRQSFLIEEQGVTHRGSPVGIVAIGPDGHTFKYVEFLRRSAELEMYDLTLDPWELSNLVGAASHAAIQQWLAGELNDAYKRPVVEFTAGPSGAVGTSDVTFAWSSNKTSDFDCSLDGAEFVGCGTGTSTTISLTGLALSTHTFRIRAVDRHNNVSETIAREFTVTADTTPPGPPEFLETPSDPSGQDVAFAFSGDEDAVSFTCSLDAAEAQACVSPVELVNIGHGEHVFEVRARDAAGNTSAPTGFRWNVIDVSAPESPRITRAPADRSAPDVEFSFVGDEEAVAFDCSLDGSALVGCRSPHSYTGLADGEHVFRVGARDGAGNVSALTSLRWTVDDSPPAPALVERPPDPGGPDAVFSFTGPMDQQCSLDGDPFEACSSPRAYDGLADGTHTFRVRTVDASGETSGSASYTWTVDTVAPVRPDIVATPADPSLPNGSVSFASPETDVVFRCSLDDGPYESCTSPWEFVDLPDGTHTFRVVAADAAGNTSTPASFTWSVDGTPPPAPRLTDTPRNPSGTTASFSFVGDDPGASFECSLDGARFARCSSPVFYGSLGAGYHNFQVRALDAAGNLSPATAYDWFVDAVTPVVTLGGQNNLLRNNAMVQVSWSGSDDNGIVRYDVYERAGTGGAQRLVQSGTAARYQANGVEAGTYCYQVRGYDAAGNFGTSEEKCQSVPVDDRDPSLSYFGPVTPLTAFGSYMATLTALGGPGEAVEYSFTGQKFGLLVHRSPESGQADVFLDGTLVARVDFYASTVMNRNFVYERVVSDGPHTVRVEWTGSRNAASSGTAVHIDGFGSISVG